MRARRAGTAWPQRGIVATAARRSQARLYRALLRAQPGPRQGDTPKPVVDVAVRGSKRLGSTSEQWRWSRKSQIRERRSDHLRDALGGFAEAGLGAGQRDAEEALAAGAQRLSREDGDALLQQEAPRPRPALDAVGKRHPQVHGR